MIENGASPTFGPWHDFRQRLPLGDYGEKDLPWERYLVGTPEEVAEGLIRPHEQAPHDHFCFWGRLPGVTHEQAQENTRPFASEMTPGVREATKARAGA